MAMPVNMAKILATQLAAQTASINGNVDAKAVATQTAVATESTATQAVVTTASSDTQGVVNTKAAATDANVNAQTQQIDTQLDSMSTVGGTFDSNVTAINTHSTAARDYLKTSTDNRAAEVKSLVTSETTAVESHVTAQNTITKNAVNNARDSINGNTDNEVAAAKTLVTSEHTTTKNVVTSARDNVKTHVSDELSAGFAAKTLTDTADKDEIKAYINSQLAALSLSPVKSIQRGSVSLSYAQNRVHVVISAVDMAKSTINISCASGFTTKGGNNNAAYGFDAGAYFSGSTGVYVQAGGDDASGFHTPCVAYWEVIEYV